MSDEAMTAEQCIEKLRTLILGWCIDEDDARDPVNVLEEAIAIISEFDVARVEETGYVPPIVFSAMEWWDNYGRHMEEDSQ